MSSIDRAAYRIRQLRRTLRPRVAPSERDEAKRILGERLYPLFESMQTADQRHCLDVFERLTAEGCSDIEILQASLIHDAGKGRIAGARFGVHHRVLFVALQRLPKAIDALARRNRGIRSLQAHDARTVELAREYGAPDGVVLLLGAMAGGPADNRALSLMAADDQS